MNIIETNLQFGTLTARKSTTRAILHHAEAKTCSAADIHNWHKQRGWSGMGYHFLVRKDGTIERGRPEHTHGAHATGSNYDSIGICFEGSFMTETMSQTQIRAGQELLAYLKKKYSFTKVQKHKDVQATNCPGTNFPFEEIVGNTSVPETKPEQKPAENKNMNPIIRDGQVHARNFAAQGLSADGIRGPKTKQASVKVLQQGMNKDYKSGLELDGLWGQKSEAALKWHYVRMGEKQYMVTALEILLMLHGYNPNGVENPGYFGDGLEKAVKQYQEDHGLTVDGIAGYNTFKSLIA